MKTLRFLGIALLACSMMFVSCKKDNPQPDNSTSQEQQGNGDNQGGGEETPGVYVTFGSESWTVGDFSADVATFASFNTMMIWLAKNENSYPQVQSCMQNAVGSTSEVSEQRYVIYMENQNDVNENGFPNWQSKSLNSNVTAIDLTAHQVSATVTGSLQNLTTEESRDIKIDYRNAEWTPATVEVKGAFKKI